MSGMLHLIYRRKQLTPEEESKICIKCQFCCRWIGFHSHLKVVGADYFGFITNWGAIPVAFDGQMVDFYIPFPCQHIKEGVGCLKYQDRPEVCRKFKGGDTDPAIIPYCGWYEPIPDDQKFKALKSIEWGDQDKHKDARQ